MVDRQGVIRAGNGTYHAARSLGWNEIDVVRSDLEGVEATAFAIADNRRVNWPSGTGSSLAKLLEDLRDQDALDGVGFDDAEIDEMLAELAPEEDPLDLDHPGEQKPPEKPISRTGNLWILGGHRLLVGDSTNAASVERLMAGEKASLLEDDAGIYVWHAHLQQPGATLVGVTSRASLHRHG